MKLLSIVLGRSITWRIHPNDPILFKLDCLPGWSLVNPLLNEGVLRAASDHSTEMKTKATFVVGELAYLNSTGFYLALENDIHYDWSAENAFDLWDKRLYMLLKYLRYASKQVTLSSNIMSFGPIDINEVPLLEFPDKGKECATQAWHIKTAIGKDDIELVSGKSLVEPPPAYDGMLLDAIQALMNEDYRTAILFSAIAMENLARMKLLASFEVSFDENVLDRALKIELLPATDLQNNITRKSRLANLLIERSRFAELLDPISLILSGRSLLAENKDLYDEACKIYKDRNGIVHKGLTPDNGLTRFAGIYEAIEAVNCAIQLVEWFGERGGYVNPYDKSIGHIKCHSAIPKTFSSDPIDIS